MHFPPTSKSQITHTRTFGQAKGRIEITFMDDKKIDQHRPVLVMTFARRQPSR
ncbi:hypothetical protein [Streptomyces sp. TLI_105]|uniref:hypothetical protein n=1 Tax=Streptomyces sp. TLI_105 TaxID=1881019 RepID=UPI000895A5AD|nr:hypothetical protein [Streptomyces sp. TLI_105]SEB58783.1 hypothetical protein SAMN05428939_0093 [Streptomyces sp. TLI_105]